MAIALFTNMIEDDEKKKRCIGLLLMAVAGLFLTLGNSLYQYIELRSPAHISSSQMLMVRCIIQLLFSIAFMVHGKVHIYGEFKQNVIPLISMGVAEVCVIIFMYEAIERMPVGDATVLQFTAPIFTAILSFIFFKTRCRWFDALCGVLSFVGVVFIVKPNILFPMKISVVQDPHYNATARPKPVSDVRYTEGGCFAIAASFCISLFFILNKLNAMKLDVTLTIFYPSVMGIVIGPIVMLFRREIFLLSEISGPYWGILLFIGFTSFIGLMLLGQSLQMQDPGPAILIRNCDAVYAYILQYLLCHIPPTGSAGIGTALILLCSSLIILNHSFNLDQKICGDTCGEKGIKDYDDDDEEARLLLLNNNENEEVVTN